MCIKSFFQSWAKKYIYFFKKRASQLYWLILIQRQTYILLSAPIGQLLNYLGYITFADNESNIDKKKIII